jgi:hypothetical protein
VCPLSNDPEKVAAWQARARERALLKLKERGAKLAPRERSAAVAKPGTLQQALKDAKPKKKKPRPAAPNDSAWRNACIMARGEVCRSCGDTAHVEMDHVIPKSQDPTARADVENGLPLCGAFSRNTPGGCHPAKTAGTLKFEPGWLDPDQLAYLARKGWVDWDEHGQPFGRGMNHFLPKGSAGAMKGGH